MSVVVQDLTKRFARTGKPAVTSASFEAPSGAITSIIGPSGAGKSTVLRVIAGLESPDEGAVRIDGVDCLDTPAQSRGVGLVFQSYALFRNMTVAENVAFGLEVARPRVAKADIAARVAELLELVQLGGHAKKLPSQLSGGERQRVAFARALAIRPKVLLLDEPFGALDARVRRELRDWLCELHERTQLTTIIVTHDQEEALEISEHVVVMFGGCVAQAGAPREIYERPNAAPVATFLGANLVGDGGYVRPEEVKIERENGQGGREGGERGSGTGTGTGTERGRIERVRVVGGRVKVAVVMAAGDRLTVEMRRGEFEALDVAVGESVLVDTRAARVFLEDFAI